MSLLRPSPKTPPGAGLDLIAPRRDGYRTSGELVDADERIARSLQDARLPRPVLTWGPWHFFDLAASATTDGVYLMPSAAATLATSGNAGMLPTSGRVVGCNLVLSGSVVSGTAAVRAKVGSSYHVVGATAAAGETTAQSWLGWVAGVPVGHEAALEGAILTASLNPTTLEARLILYVMLDTDATR